MSLMKKRVLFVGVGQFGGNLVKSLEGLGYTGFYINTSMIDLDSLKEVDSKFKYHIPNATGCAKDRDLAKGYARNYYDTIADTILSKFGTFDVIFFCFSMGGGTGGGIAPTIINVLSQLAPNTTIGAITLFPSEEESFKIKHNAITCYKELSKINNLKNVYVLENKVGVNKFEINTQFSVSLHQILTVSKADIRGVVDEKEVETMLNVKGSVVVSKLEKGEVVPYPCFTSHDMGAKYHVYSIREEEDLNKAKIKELFGEVYIDEFKGYNDTYSYVASFGLPLPTLTFNKLVEDFRKQKEMIQNVNSDPFSIDVDIQDLDFANIQIIQKNTLSEGKKLSDLLNEI